LDAFTSSISFFFHLYCLKRLGKNSMPATLRDIAKKVGLSVTTVSRAVNDYSDVNPETKERIRRAAREMDYHPHVIAQKLQKQKTDTIGFIIPTTGPRFSDPFFLELLTGIGNEAARQEFDLLVSTRAPGDQEMEAYRRIVNGKRVDGIVLTRTRHGDQRISCLMDSDFPFVAFGRCDLPYDFPYVDVDGREGMSLVTQHLVDLGHRRLAYITAPLELMFATYRLEGHKEALATNDIPIDADLILAGDLTERAGYEAAKQLLGRRELPTAIVACNDLMALGAMSAALERGMVIGEDISITGFDDIPLAAHSHPPLTTVQQPIYEIGIMICCMLVQIIKGEEPVERHVVLEPRLVVRRSSGVPVQGRE